MKEKKVRVKKSKKKRGLDKVIELQGDTTPDRAAFLQVQGCSKRWILGCVKFGETLICCR